MRSALEVDDEAETFGALLDALATQAVIRERDVHRLRHVFYAEGRLDRRAAAHIFHANRIMQVRHDAWTEFYLEALTDYFLTVQQGRHILAAEAEAALLGWLGAGAAISDCGERRLALRILLRAANGPEGLERRVLQAIEEALLRDSRRWLGPGRRKPGIIDALDLHLIQRLLRGVGGSCPQLRRRSVVAFLLRLDRRALGFVDPGGWHRLLVASLVHHLRADLAGGCTAGADLGPAFSAGIATLLDGHGPVAAVEQLRHDVLAAARILQGGEGDLTSVQRIDPGGAISGLWKN